MKLRLVLAVLLTLTFFGLTSAFAQFTPSQDSYTTSGAANRGTNYGSAPTLNVASATRTAYIQFDLSSIPAGYGPNVAKASLKLYVNAVTTAGTFNVVYINGVWSESTITYNLSPALGTQIATGPEVSSSNVHDYVNIDVTTAVKAWLENSEPNDGLALVANTPLVASFDSKENSAESHPPELDIVFAPGVGTITGITTASGSGLEGGATSGSPSLSLIPCTTVGEILSWTTTGWACSPMSLSNEFVPLTGGTMTGTLSVPSLAGNSAGQLNITSPVDINVKSNATMELSASSSLTISAPFVSISNLSTTGFTVLSGASLLSPMLQGTTQADAINLQPNWSVTPSTANSSPLIFQAASQNSSTGTLVKPFFQWQSEPTGTNTANPGATMNLLYGADYNTSTTPIDTHLSIASNGIITFNPGQTFPGGSGGGGTITGVTAGTGLSGGGTTGNVPLSVNENVVAFQSDLSAQIAAVQTFATTAATNAQYNAVTYANDVFVPLHGGTMLGPLTVLANGLTAGGNQLVLANNNVGIGTATPASTLDVSGTVNAANAFNLGGTLFDYGSPASRNAFLGYAGNGTNPGTDNVASGWQALAAAAGGGSNVASGYFALNSDSTGSFNTALGAYAGQTGDRSLMAGNNNTFLGAGSEAAYGSNSNGPITNATAIGSNSVVGESNALVLGSIAGQNSATNNTMVGIGTTKPLATLDVEALSGTPSVNFFGSSPTPGTFTVNGTGNFTGAVTFGSLTQTFPNTVSAVTVSGGGLVETGTGSVNLSLPTCGNLQVLQMVGSAWTCAAVSTGGGGITGSGTVGSLPLFATLNSVASSNLFQGLTGNIGIGTATPQATLDVNGIINLPNTTSSYVGMLSLGGAPFISNYPGVSADNTFVGISAGNQIMAGSAIQNTAVGNSALTANTIGYDNSAFGFQALNANTLGNNNSAFGPSTLALNTVGNVNSAFGYGALGANKTGNANAAFGGSALGANESGSNNTAVGGAALGQLGSSTGTGGSTNIAIGFLAGYNLTGVESNNIDIGHQGVLLESNTIRIGDPTVQTAAYIAGTLNVANLKVSGTCTGCGGGGGGITSVTGTNGVNASTSGGAVTLSLNTAATNTFTGTQTFNVPTGNGIVAETAGNSNAGISGSNNSALGGGAGVAGFSVSGSGSGVVGTNSSSSLGGGYGVQGLSYNAADPGVGGINNSPAAGGVYGVFGQSLGSNGTGVYGTGNGSGVTGNASSSTGSGVVGTNFSTSGSAYGLYGQSSSQTGTGVFGTGNGSGVTGSSSAGYGVLGQSNGTTSGSAGIYGSATSQAAIGVLGSNNAGGWAGFFSGPVLVQGTLQSTGDVNFLGNAAVTGTLAIGGGTPMSHTPTMTWSSFLPGNLGNSPIGGVFVPDASILITRLLASTNSPGTSCTTPATVEVIDFPNNQFLPIQLVMSNNTQILDSSPISVAVPAGDRIYVAAYPAFGCTSISGQSPSDVNVTVQYVMQ